MMCFISVFRYVTLGRGQSSDINSINNGIDASFQVCLEKTYLTPILGESEEPVSVAILKHSYIFPSFKCLIVHKFSLCHQFYCAFNSFQNNRLI